jgi:hypothetical protein
MHKKKKKCLCVNCEDWIEEHMPGVSAEKLYVEKMDDTEMAEEMKETMDSHKPSNSTKEPELEVAEIKGLDCIVDQHYTLFTHNQVLRRWKQTPRALKLRAVKVNVHNKSLTQKHVRYPFPAGMSMKLRCVVGLRSKTELRSTEPALLSKQGDMLMDSAFQALMDESKTSNLFRLQPVKSIDKVIKAEGGKIGDTSDDDACGGESGTNEEGSEEGVAVGALARGRSNEGLGQRSSSSRLGARTPARSRQTVDETPEESRHSSGWSCTSGCRLGKG